MAHKVLVPPLGQTVDVVTLVQWYKREGDEVKEGEPLFVIATDKAELDVEAQSSGVLCQVMAQEGDEVEALSTIALITTVHEVVKDPPQARATDDKHTTVSRGLSTVSEVTIHQNDASSTSRERLFISPRARRLAAAEAVPLRALTGTGPEGAIVEQDVRTYLDLQEKVIITPVAERMARERGVDLNQVPGSGLRGRITLKDVELAIGGAEGKPPSAARSDNEVGSEMPLQGMRAIIAEHMMQSISTTAQVTLTSEADATELVTLRQQLIIDGVKVSYNDLLLYMLARALQEHPELNASLEHNVVRRWRHIHIGLAVDTDRGLVVPVVRNVSEKRLAQLAHETADLVRRTRESKVTPDELRGGTFTLTNLGMYDIDAFTPILNLPETAILGVGRIKTQPAVVNNSVTVRQMVWLSLTFDHRLVDGAQAARFLQRVVQLLENPHHMHS